MILKNHMWLLHLKGYIFYIKPIDFFQSGFRGIKKIKIDIFPYTFLEWDFKFYLWQMVVCN